MDAITDIYIAQKKAAIMRSRYRRTDLDVRRTKLLIPKLTALLINLSF